MTIGAVSSTNYSTSIQYQYFGTTVSDDRIQELLNEYGIQTTGYASIDLQNLYDAMSSIATNNVKGAQSNQQQGPPPANSVPWADVMNQVGLSPTGDISTDQAAFNQQIYLMQVSATSPQDKASIAQIQAQADIAFSEQSTDSSQSSPQISGADIMAQLNKMYMLG